MIRKFVAFDLETAKAVPMYKWKEYRPLGIACAATVRSDTPGDVKLWYGTGDMEATQRPRADGPSDGELPMFDAELYPTQAGALLDHLTKAIADGYYIVTWNGLSFDFCMVYDAVLDERKQAVIDLAMSSYHIDIQFAMTTGLGYAVGLKTACEGMQVEGKMEGMHGSAAPLLWHRDREAQDKVLAYVRRDAIATANVFRAISQHGFMQWISRSGRLRYWETGPTGILSVEAALREPDPDQEWMNDPIDRHEAYAWTKEPLEQIPF